MKTTSSEVKYNFLVNTSDHVSGHYLTIRPGTEPVVIFPEGHYTGTIIECVEEIFHTLIGDKELPDSI